MTTAQEVEDAKNKALSSLDDKDLESTFRTTFALAEVLDSALNAADWDYELAYSVVAKTVLTILADLETEFRARGLA